MVLKYDGEQFADLFSGKQLSCVAIAGLGLW